MKRLIATLLATLMVLSSFVFVVSAAGADFTTINQRINLATTLKNEVYTSYTGYEVPASKYWVTPAVMAILDNALANAKAVVATGANASQITVDQRCQELENALSTFQANMKAGLVGYGNGIYPSNPSYPTYPSYPSYTTATLTQLVNQAKTLKVGVTTSTNGVGLSTTQKWVTPAEMTAFDNAIASAEAAIKNGTASALYSAYQTLTSAMSTFSYQIKIGSGAFVPTASLSQLIAQAKAMKTGVVTSTNGAGLATTQRWVTSAEMTAFDNAIASAEAAAKTNNAATITSATQALSYAMTLFQNQIKIGSGVYVPTTSLSQLIAQAYNLKAGVVTSTNGAGLSTSQKWVTTAEMTAFNNAIASAEAALRTNNAATMSSASQALSYAMSLFQSQIRLGTSGSYLPSVPSQNSLYQLITQAHTLKNSVVVSENGIGLYATQKWVPEIAMINFTVVISKAEYALYSSDASKIAYARTELAEAINTFSAQIKVGPSGSAPEVLNPYAALAPTANIESGSTVDHGTFLKIMAQDGAKIYYTTDGTNPTTASKLYTEKFALVKDVTVKAIAVVPGKVTSPIAVFTYKVKAAPEFDNVNSRDIQDAITYLIDMGYLTAATAGFDVNKTITYGDFLKMAKALDLKVPTEKFDYISGVKETDVLNYEDFCYIVHRTLYTNKVIKNPKTSKNVSKLKYASELTSKTYYKIGVASFIENNLFVDKDAFKPQANITAGEAVFAFAGIVQIIENPGKAK